MNAQLFWISENCGVPKLSGPANSRTKHAPTMNCAAADALSISRRFFAGEQR
jgi:hypothetical protein